MVLGDGTVHPQNLFPPAEQSEAGGLNQSDYAHMNSRLVFFAMSVYWVDLYLFPVGDNGGSCFFGQISVSTFAGALAEAAS